MKRIAFIGGGNMAEALIAGLVRSGDWKPSQIIATDVRAEALAKLKKAYRVQTTFDNRTAVKGASIILLAVKPQQMTAVLEEIGPLIHKSQLVLSIAAGIPTRAIERLLAKGVPVVRVMPNTPALVGAGAAGIARGRFAKATHQGAAAKILATVGTVSHVAEADLDAVTAVSGSGPAYVFYLAEAMMEAAQSLGLKPAVAQALVRQTIKGAGELLSQSPDDAAALRRRVTSPGGTTEAAINVLEQEAVRQTFVKALQRASARSQELSKGM